MIRVSDELTGDRTPWRPDPETRLRRGRWMTAAALVLAALAVAAGAAPMGAFYTLVFGGLVLFPFWLAPYAIGLVHAFHAWRRERDPEVTRAFRWWCAPLVILPAALLLAFSDLPWKVALDLAQDDLEALLEEAAAAPEHQTKLDPRFVGPWPAVEIFRYSTGQLRLQLEGSANGAGDRGLCYCPDGEPLPGRYGEAELRDLGDGWYGWFKAEPR